MLRWSGPVVVAVTTGVVAALLVPPHTLGFRSDPRADTHRATDTEPGGQQPTVPSVTGTATGDGGEPDTPETTPLGAELDDHGFSRLGVTVFDRTAETTVLRHNAGRTFSSASLVKLLIALESLRQGEPAGQVRGMLSRSDDDLAGVLWVRHGRTRIVTTWAAEIGLDATAPPTDPARWGDTVTTPDDLVRTYRYLLDDAPTDVRAVVFDGLRESTPYGADGFDQTFGLPDAAGTRPSAVKQGWSCCVWDRVLHTSGVVGHDDRFVVVVLTRSPVAVSWETASARVTDVTTRIVNRLPG